ncbi:tryptophan synthase subunit alpha [Bacillus fonticola]|uniref:tryptophan synthase subunit alpha n=1 Tax=Bacillus fonticola TaxID=2728853 RepID=UPI001476364A|nr:tryptophan synthase subunit alpha [Bacillus fonticola]
MNPIHERTQTVQQQGGKAFVPYVMAGDPSLEKLPEQLLFLQEAGATCIEVGIPFSDPVADGPTIQAAGIRALAAGVTTEKVFQTLDGVKEELNTPLLLMVYTNTLFAYGVDAFLERANAVGVSGLIVPDLPYEEESLLSNAIEKEGLILIRLVTLTSPDSRVEMVTKEAKGFLYAVTVKGTTGAREGFPIEELQQFADRIRNVSNLPVYAGFGISTPVHVQEMTNIFDGVIVGSKIVQSFHEGDLDTIQELIAGTGTPRILSKK